MIYFQDDTTSEADMLDQSPTMSRALRSGNVRGVQHMQHNTRRPRGGSMRGQQRITPIVWNQQQQQQHQQMQQQQQQQQQQGMSRNSLYYSSLILISY